ncbi:hypothetical protein DUNSADRAFT_12608 [Dunaliella salina]|uniref:Secreted protein n=1 Tax=Dunaliella salina TaxID=3046 RepID=A0ABQ7GAY9_DUNSA|nr:hypothetical protein DUNSADRAFT_12608 [Dunaliella salina]|eukprot:KAF5831770.1 hypothetical protein DUNSADRAFT_12608 [Dunaliella salina]
MNGSPFHLPACAVAVVIAAYVHWRVVLVLLEWRDASGGCAVPVTSGPLHSVLEDMRTLGHELLHIDQVWTQLCSHAAGHLGLAGPTPDVP